MMEFLRAKATRTRVSEAIYIFLNGLVPIAVFFLVRYFDQPYPAIALVLLMKWRIFSLRPRYWWTTLKINMVDIVVGLSIVGLMYGASGEVVVQILLAALYAGWLLIIKPMSSDRGVMLQAGVAQFLGLSALFQFYVLPEFFAIVASWVIGYVVARHMVSNYDEPHIEVLAGLWGLIVAQLAWLTWRWTVVYDIGLPIRIPQIALIMLVIGFCAARMHHASKQDKMSQVGLRGTAIFGAALLLIILAFSPWDATV
jgi:hypothetical protein